MLTEPLMMKNICQCTNKSANGHILISQIKNMVNGMDIYTEMAQLPNQQKGIFLKVLSIFLE